MVERGLVSREDRARLAVAERREAGSSGRLDYSATLLRELTAHRTAALRIELANRPDVALAAVVHKLVLSMHHARSYSCLGLSLRSRALDRDATTIGDCDAHRQLEERDTMWRERLPEEPDGLWRWCLTQPQETLIELLALVTALSIDAVEERPASTRTAALAHSDRLAEALILDMAEHWQATPDFLIRLSKPVMARAGGEAGNTMLANNLAVMKKDAAARHAATALAGKRWLPPALQTPQPAVVEGVDDDPGEPEAEAA